MGSSVAQHCSVSAAAAVPQQQQQPSHNLCPATVCSLQNCAASITAQVEHESGHRTRCARKSIVCFSPPAYQERCFVTLEPKSISSKTGLACCILRQAGKGLEVTGQALLVSSHPQHQITATEVSCPGFLGVANT